MASIRNLFILETPYEEDKEEFYEFMENNVQEFFSDVGNTRYTVPYLLVKSTINKGRRNYKGAKHREVWLQVSSMINYIQSNSKYNNMHKSEIFMMIHHQAGGSYERLMNVIQKFLEEWYSHDLQFNILKYTAIKKQAQLGRFI